MDSRIRRAFKPTRLRITKETVPAEEQRNTLESLFLTIEAAKTDAVTAERKAAISVSKAKSQREQANIAELEFLNKASDNFTQIAGESIWIVYRDTEGIITMEGFTERLIRNNIRAQQEILGKQVDGGEDIDTSGLYETDENPEENG